MAYVAATAKTQLRARIDAGLGAVVDAPGGLKRQALVDAIVDWIGTDVLPTLAVATAVTGTTAVASGSSAGTWPTTGTGSGGIT